MEWIIHGSLLKGLSLSQTGIYIVCTCPLLVYYLCTLQYKRAATHTVTHRVYTKCWGVDIVSISWSLHKIQLP